MFQHFDLDLTHQVPFLYIFPSHLVNLRDQPWKWTYAHLSRTHICSCKLSAKLALMLGNPFPVPSLCKLNHISVCFIQISTKITCNQGKPYFFWSDPRCFGPLDKFEHNVKISLKTARVSRLSFRFLWLWCYIKSSIKKILQLNFLSKKLIHAKEIVCLRFKLFKNF